MKTKKKKEPKRKLAKKELLELLLNKEKEELDKMEEMIDLLIAKNITINVNGDHDDEKTFGERMSDKVASFAGSWGFIMTFLGIILLWILSNLFLLTQPFDKYPFILLNLLLSCVAALQAPIIMMSQNRQEKKDRMRSDNDYKIDLKAEFILEDIYNSVKELKESQTKILDKVKTIEKTIEKIKEEN